MKIKSIGSLLTTLGLLCIFPLTHLTQKAYAKTEQFSTEYKIHFDFQENGEAVVTQNINVTNLVSDVIASSYTLTFKQMEVYGISATVNNKSIEPEKTSENNETKIKLNITNYVIGEGRQNKIELIYKTTDLSSKVGEIWNINIPKTEFTKSTAFYNVQLSIPNQFGPKVYISPSPVTEENSNGKTNYYLTREQLIDKGISASFGKYQIVNFRLTYQIENPSILPGTYEIALPPDIPHIQQVKYENITPAPKNVVLDSNGNAMARYKIKSRGKLEITVTGKARITGRQINSEFGGEMDNIPKKYIKAYTNEQPYWEVNSPEIQKIAKTLINEDNNVIQNAQETYNYVVNNLEYNYEAVENGNIQRNGALKAATQKKPWTCMEFSDLFITIARSMGIPAREINGHAFSNLSEDKPLSIKLRGGDYLHAWAEFYDPFYGWIQVDPTWGNTAKVDYFTKTDTNHFAFVIRGTESEYPLPAGTYRFSDIGNLVDVDFAQEEDPRAFEEKLILIKKRNFNILQILRGNQKFKLKNEGHVFVYDINNKIQNLAPDEEVTLFLPKGSSKVRYETFNGEVVEKSLMVID